MVDLDGGQMQLSQPDWGPNQEVHAETHILQLPGGCVVHLNTINEADLTQTEELDEEKQQEALIYIVVVLLFYLVSIVVLMVKYIRRQRRQWQEDKMYTDFLAKARLIAVQESKYLWTKSFSLKLQQVNYPDPTQEKTDPSLCQVTCV